MASAETINFPGNLAGVDTFAELRTVPAFFLLTDAAVLVRGGAADGDGSGGMFTWVPGSLEADNGSTVIKPANLTSLQAGRWKKIDALPSLQQTSSGHFYVNEGGKVQRLNDRLFVGGATKNLGTNAGSQPDWLTTSLLALGRTFAFQQVTQFAALSDDEPVASNAILGAARTSLFPGDNYGAIGIIGVGFNNNTTKTCNAYGGYFEGYQIAGANGTAYAAEFDVAVYNPTRSIDPYAQSSGQTVGVQIAAGAEYSAAGQYDASSAINIRSNRKSFQRGIVFGNDSLSNCDGVIGTAIAMAMAKGHGLQWYSSTGTPTSSIYGENASPEDATTMRFVDTGVSFSTLNGKTILKITNSGGTAVNGLTINPSATGNAVSIQTTGDDTNIDLRLQPKGTGAIWLGPWSSNADEAITGYIACKDQSGNIRRLATIG